MNQILAQFILLALQEQGSLGMAETLLLQQARTEVSAALTLPELQAMLRAQADEGLLIQWTPRLAALRWKITEQGTLLLREKKLA
ncbi:MAG: hypothetical protein HZA93_13210 [Verrucomicrobia bacterium]|nr:hypothetical protein [Verrucomicrobiota bacterium]